MGTITYDFENADRRPSRPKRMFYLFLWFLIVFGTPFFSTYFWSMFVEHATSTEALAGATTIVVCICPAEVFWFYRGMIFIAFTSNRNLVLSKLAKFSISYGHLVNPPRNQQEEDDDFFYFFDPNGPNGHNLWDDHDKHH